MTGIFGAGRTWGMKADKAEDWRLRAACRDHDPELFFNDTQGALSIRQADEAKAVCQRCPVISSCYAWVTANPQPYGIFAGLTPEQRRGGKPKLRWCECCSNSFDLDPLHPNARLCLACQLTRERFGDLRSLLQERTSR